MPRLHRSVRPTAAFRSTVPTALRALLAFVALAVGLGLVPSVATAATYEIRQCNDGSGRGLAVTPGFIQIWEDRPVSNTCEAGGNLSINLNPNALAPYSAQASRMMGYSFVLPAAAPNAKITRAVATLWVAPLTSDPGLSDMQVALHSDGNPVEYDRLHNFSSWGGLPHLGRGGDLPVASRFARFLLYCWAPCDFQATPAMALDGATITIDDPLPPAAPTFEASGLLDGAAQKGTKLLRFGVTDADSGIKRIELRTATGVQLASTPDGESCSYTRPIPCPQERLGQSFSVDTTRLADGKQTLELWVTDAAGLQRKTAVAPFTVQNAVAPVATPAPTGTTPTATPTPTPTPVATIPTPFVSPNLSSSGAGSPAPAADAGPVVSFKVSSKTPRAGERVTFSGAVAPAPSAAGRLIIEARTGKKWITAAVVRTRTAGTFTWSHRFSRRGPYTMRARLLTSVEAKTRPAVSPNRSFRVH